MKSIEVEINGKMTPVCFADDVDKVTSEMRERHEKEMNLLEAHWEKALKNREQELRQEFCEQEAKNRKILARMDPPPKTFFDEVCQVVRTCEKDGNPAPAYDFLRGLSAGWWMCHEVESPPQESVEDRMRKWMNKPKEEK